MYPIIAKATFFDDYDHEQTEVNTLLFADNLAEAAQMMDDYCRPETLSLTFIGDGIENLIEIPEELANALILGNGNVTEGYKILKG